MTGIWKSRFGRTGFSVLQGMDQKNFVTSSRAFLGLSGVSAALVAGLQAWKRNILLSILAGTACYMLLTQMVF